MVFNIYIIVLRVPTDDISLVQATLLVVSLKRSSDTVRVGGRWFAYLRASADFRRRVQKTCVGFPCVVFWSSFCGFVADGLVLRTYVRVPW